MLLADSKLIMLGGGKKEYLGQRAKGSKKKEGKQDPVSKFSLSRGNVSFFLKDDELYATTQRHLPTITNEHYGSRNIGLKRDTEIKRFT